MKRLLVLSSVLVSGVADAGTAAIGLPPERGAAPGEIVGWIDRLAKNRMQLLDTSLGNCVGEGRTCLERRLVAVGGVPCTMRFVIEHYSPRVSFYSGQREGVEPELFATETCDVPAKDADVTDGSAGLRSSTPFSCVSTGARTGARRANELRLPSDGWRGVDEVLREQLRNWLASCKGSPAPIETTMGSMSPSARRLSDIAAQGHFSYSKTKNRPGSRDPVWRVTAIEPRGCSAVVRLESGQRDYIYFNSWKGRKEFVPFQAVCRMRVAGARAAQNEPGLTQLAPDLRWGSIEPLPFSTFQKDSGWPTLMKNVPRILVAARTECAYDAEGADDLDAFEAGGVFQAVADDQGIATQAVADFNAWSASCAR